MKLFHATYWANLESIMEYGLGAVQRKNWEISTDGGVCFADDIELAISFCECAEAVDEEVFESGIVCLEVDSGCLLEELLGVDPNWKDEENPEACFLYRGVVAPENLRVLKEDYCMTVFTSNKACAAALYRHLVKIGAIGVDDDYYTEDSILHDINNLRGYELLEMLPRTAETEAFFAYLGHEDEIEGEDLEELSDSEYGHDVEKIKDLADVFLQQVDFIGNECAFTDRLLEDLLKAAADLYGKYYQKDMPIKRTDSPNMDYASGVATLQTLAGTFLQQADFIGNECAYTDRLLEDLLKAAADLCGRYYQQDMVANQEGLLEGNSGAAVMDSAFICDAPISPELYWELATGEAGVVVPSLDALRDMMDDAELGEVWDYPLADMDEAVANNAYLVIVESPVAGEEPRVFEVAEEMLPRFDRIKGFVGRGSENAVSLEDRLRAATQAKPEAYSQAALPHSNAVLPAQGQGDKGVDKGFMDLGM